MKSTQDPGKGGGGVEKPNTSGSWAESWRTWQQSLVKDIPLHNERWSVPFLTLWKILARC